MNAISALGLEQAMLALDGAQEYPLSMKRTVSAKVDKHRKTVAGAAIGGAALLAQATPAAAQGDHYAVQWEMFGDLGVASTLTVPANVVCAGGAGRGHAFAYNDDIWQMAGNHGDGNIDEWSELMLKWCTDSAPAFWTARCFSPSAGNPCDFNRTKLSYAVPAGGSTIGMKIVGSNGNGWSHYLGSTFVASYADLTPPNAFGGNWSEVGLEERGQTNIGSHSNAGFGGILYKGSDGAWHDYGTDAGCSADHPAEGNDGFGPNNFVFNYRGGAGTC